MTKPAPTDETSGHDTHVDATSAGASIGVDMSDRREHVLLAEFRSWLVSQQAEQGGEVLPKSPMGQASQYAPHQWGMPYACIPRTDGWSSTTTPARTRCAGWP